VIFTNLLYSSNGPSIPVEDKIFSTECICLQVALKWILRGNNFAKEHTAVKMGREEHQFKEIKDMEHEDTAGPCDANQSTGWTTHFEEPQTE